MKTGLTRDITAAIFAIVFFLLTNFVATIASNSGYDDAFHLVAFALRLADAMVIALIAWVVIRLGFPKTLGAAMDQTFDDGWGQMSKKEKTRWITGVFVALFLSLAIFGSQ